MKVITFRKICFYTAVAALLGLMVDRMFGEKSE